MSKLPLSIPDGYELTEHGVFPKEWDIKAIGEIASVSSGGTPNRKVKDFWDGEIPWVTTTLINGNNISYANEFITKKGLESSSAKMCKAGTILMAMYGQGKTRGKVGVLTIDASINQACAAIEVNSSDSGEYILHTLNYMYEDIRELSNSGGQENLSSGIIKGIKLPLPSKSEQTTIANALSDVDALLTELEKLLAKKQSIKTATMQQLLTGKTRLANFTTYTEGKKQGQPKGTKPSELGEIPEDWDVVKFGSIVNYIKGYPFKSAEYTDSGIRVVRVSDTSFTSIKNENPIFVSENSRRKYKKWSLEKGNIIFTTVGSKPPMYDSLVGKAILVESHHEGFLLNQNAVLIKPKLAAENISNLLVSHFRTERYIDHIEQIYRGNANQASITLDGLFEFEIPLPTEPEEQTAIAIILSDMDNEIQILEQRLAKTRQIKQGMMQELLTGRTRLPIITETL